MNLRTTGLLRSEILSTAAINYIIMGLGFVSSILSARLLGPQGRGEFAAILNWPLLLTSIGSFGVPVALTYYCGRDPKYSGTRFMTATIFLILISLPLIAISYWLMPYILLAQSDDTIYTARIALLLILIQFGGGMPYWVLRGLQKFQTWNILRLQTPLLWIGVLLICTVTLINNPTHVVYGYLTAMSINNIFWLRGLFKTVPGPYEIKYTEIRPLLYYGAPTCLTILPQQLNLRLDQLLMAAMLSAQSLGYYVVAVAWSGLLSPLLTAISQVIFPRLASMHDRHMQSETLKITMRLSTLFMIISTILLSIVTPIALPLFFGKNFTTSISVAMLLIVAGGFSNLKSIASESLRGLGIPKWPMIAEVLGLMITVILLIILLKPYQLMGAAATVLISNMFVFSILMIFTIHELKIRLGDIIVPCSNDFVLIRSYIRKITNYYSDIIRRNFN